MFDGYRGMVMSNFNVSQLFTPVEKSLLETGYSVSLLVQMKSA